MLSLPVSVAIGLLKWLKGGFHCCRLLLCVIGKRLICLCSQLWLSPCWYLPVLIIIHAVHIPIFKCCTVPNPQFGCTTNEILSQWLSSTSAGIPPSSHCRGAPGGHPLPPALKSTWRAAALRRALEYGHKNPADLRPLTECWWGWFIWKVVTLTFTLTIWKLIRKRLWLKSQRR